MIRRFAGAFGLTPSGSGPDSTLHFVGFKNPVTGLLWEISREAVQVADTIVRRRQDREHGRGR